MKEVERNTPPRLVFPLHFFRALTASLVLYNKPEHSQGFYTVKNGTEGKGLQFSIKKT